MENQFNDFQKPTPESNQPNTTFNPTTQTEHTNPVSPIVEPPKRKRSKRVLLLPLLLLLLAGGGAAAYMLLIPQKIEAPAAPSATTSPEPAQAELTPDEAFKKMLENNRAIKTYDIKVSHTAKSKGGTNASSNVTYTYSGAVDVSNLKEMKVKAAFDLDMQGKQAKGETIWIGESLYTKLTEALVTNYQDIPCGSPGYKTAKSPSLAQLKAGYTKTVRSDFTLNCGAAAYHDFLEIIQLTNTPFSDFPHLDANTLTDLEKRAFISSQEGQYRVYDGKLTDLEGKPAYSFNVLVENYKIIEMSKALATAAGYAEDDNHIISGGLGNGFGSPGRYLTLWIDKETQQLRRVHSKVDTQDVDIKFDTIIDYSKINEPVTIVAP
jgi:hypothetical protein